jgi:GH24 family phage-related lysozyme (muramidase)
MSAEAKLTIKTSEGLRLNAYGDTANVATIGWGHASKNPRHVKGMLNGNYYEGITCPGLTITLSEAIRLFDEDVADFEMELSRALKLPPGVELAQCQVDALIEFLFQYGADNFIGSSLQDVIQKNPNNLGGDGEGILHEFSRWNKVKGVRDEAIYRRSLRRACIYAGVPIPAKLWNKNGIPFALLPDGNIDHSITPTAFQIVEQSRKASTKPKFEPDFPRKAAPEPTPTIETPAVELSPPVVAEVEPVPAPSPPAPPTIPDDNGTTVRADPVAEREPAPSSVVVPAPTLPPVLAPPKPPPVILPKTVDVRSIPYGEISPENGVKNMTDSRRFTGMLIVGAGSLIQVLAARQVVSSAAGAIFFDLSRDPVVVAIIAGGVVFVIGQITKHFGTKRITKGMTEAQSLLK